MKTKPIQEISVKIIRMDNLKIFLNSFFSYSYNWIMFFKVLKLNHQIVFYRKIFDKVKSLKYRFKETKVLTWLIIKK